MPQYWLMKTEPTVFSFADLLKSPNQTTSWDGVRNYQARNFMRDQMKRGDLVFVYHSSTDVPAIVGIAEIVREGYPEPADPTWSMVDIRAKREFKKPVALTRLREMESLKDMLLLRKGQRLSIQPVSRSEWDAIAALEK